MDISHLEQLCTRLRYEILTATTAAQSGHATSSLSAVELMAGLMFSGEFRFRVDQPEFPNNDRLIFSKGHAAPLLYALWAAAGQVTHEEMLTLRTFDSRLEGHPTFRFPLSEAATGSLGQGLAIGFGMALNAKYLDALPYKTFVLLGDSELAEGANWESIQLAAHYKLDNLIGILDVNRMGQRGETQFGHDLSAYALRVGAFGWETIVLEDGHDLQQIVTAFRQASEVRDKPVMVIAKTLKGKGVKLWENQADWHSKQLNPDQLSEALSELGEFDHQRTGELAQPEQLTPKVAHLHSVRTAIDTSQPQSTKYGAAVGALEVISQHPEVVALDAEVSNSTHFELIREEFPERFFEMFIAEQNMVGAAVGLSCRGKVPLVSTFGAFFSRAYDQIRMIPYSQTNIKFFGSYAGVSLGKDGPSQMALEDIAFFRTVPDTVILYPADAVAARKLALSAYSHYGNVYLRTTREPVHTIYSAAESFEIGGSKTLKSSARDQVTIIAAGITVHEALTAYELLQRAGVNARVIDLYSIAPLDLMSLKKAASETSHLIVVEDHSPAGGIGEAVRTALAETPTPISTLAVNKLPRSGSAQELLEYEGISAAAIVTLVHRLLA